MFSSVIVYVPGAKLEISISPFAFVVTVFENPLAPVTVKLIPATIPSSEVLTSFISPSGVIEPENAIETGS